MELIGKRQRGIPAVAAVPDVSAIEAGDVTIEPREMPPLLHESWVHLCSATADDPSECAALFDAADALVDVFPPYPPAQPPLQVVPLPVALAAARTSLNAAASASTCIEERLRISRTLRILRRIQVSA